MSVPDGFTVEVFAERTGSARHIVARENGDLFVNVVNGENGVMVLRDADGDGVAEQKIRFGRHPQEGRPTGIAIHGEHLFVSNSGGIYRYQLLEDELVPNPAYQTVLKYDYVNQPYGYEHTAKPLAFDDDGNLYVPFGSASDSCQEENRQEESPGQDPCPELEFNAGIWKLYADQLNQRQSDGTRFATGIRSATAMTWNPGDQSLYVVQHGRDYLNRMWPDLYSSWEHAVLPAEELMQVTDGSDFGWPYCYYDQLQEAKVLSPEYGGDKQTVGRCAEMDLPLIGFPGHYAPNAIEFYHGETFPDYYRGGAFIAFHGSTDRGGYPQAGYLVAFVPFEGGELNREWDLFLNGFSGTDRLREQSNAEYRPMGLAVGGDGALFVSDSVQGRIWKVTFTGDRGSFGADDRASMQEEKESASNVRNPVEGEDRF
ncbi:MAG: PQQ-dependent sugar dehydrogenase [Bacteroidota bacterium]